MGVYASIIDHFTELLFIRILLLFASAMDFLIAFPLSTVRLMQGIFMQNIKDKTNFSHECTNVEWAEKQRTYRRHLATSTKALRKLYAMWMSHRIMLFICWAFYS